MAIENVVALLQASQKNPELMAKIEAVTSSEQVVEIGAEAGFEFTTEEAEIFRQKLIEMAQKTEDGELTEEELEAAAGGGFEDIMNSMFGSGSSAGKAIDKTGNWMLNNVANPIMGPNTALGKTGNWIETNIDKPVTKAISKVFSGW